MIVTNVNLNDEVQQLLIKAAAIKQVSVQVLASEILNTAIYEKLGPLIDNSRDALSSKPALAGTQPFYFFATPEESGLPNEEWEMENDYS